MRREQLEAIADFAREVYSEQNAGSELEHQALTVLCMIEDEIGQLSISPGLAKDMQAHRKANDL